MKKNIYSLVLSEPVIRAVDREAYRRGMSRSNLIDQILAENLSCTTPEMRMRDIFDSLSLIAENSLNMQLRRSPTLMTFRTALEFKYRPTISYKLELDPQPQKYIGKLSVSIRTQNSKVVEMFDRFFLCWSATETKLLSRLGISGHISELSPVTYVRMLLNTDADENETAEAINRYLQCLNTCIQSFFSDPASFGDYSPFIEEQYIKLLEKSVI